jgi:endonuclease YncB( thermonuclease family)
MPLAVRSVTDGDTLVLADGRRVRLAQVDAPETGECFSSQSSQALRTLVEGRMVTVRRPSNGPELDRYGRTVAEVSVADRSVNEQLVREGAAEWYQEFAGEDADLAGRLGAAEADAKRAAKGLCPAARPGRHPPPPRRRLVRR